MKQQHDPAKRIPVAMPSRKTAWLVGVPERCKARAPDHLGGPQEVDGPAMRFRLQLYPRFRYGHEVVDLIWVPRLPEGGSLAQRMGMVYWNEGPTFWLQHQARPQDRAPGDLHLWRSGSPDEIPACVEADSPTEIMAALGYHLVLDYAELRLRAPMHNGQDAPSIPPWMADEGLKPAEIRHRYKPLEIHDCDDPDEDEEEECDSPG